MIPDEAAPPEAPGRLLERVRKLLAKAGDESVTPPEAQALTAKAAELMAKYGIDRALLAADQPETDRPADRIVTVENPWGRVKAHLLTGLATALRCQCVLLPARDGMRVHLFGYASDLERADLLYTSLLVQMWHGLAAELAARLRQRGGRPGPHRRGDGGQPGRRRQQARLGVKDRAGAGRPLGRHPRPRRPGLPAAPPEPDQLQRQRLRDRIRPGPAGRHRHRPVRPARRPPGRRPVIISES